MNFDLKKVKIASDGKVEVCYNLPNEDPTRAQLELEFSESEEEAA